MNSYEYDLGKQRMDDVVRGREQDRLSRELRLSSRGPRKSLAVRGVAFILGMFR